MSVALKQFRLRGVHCWFSVSQQQSSTQIDASQLVPSLVARHVLVEAIRIPENRGIPAYAVY